MKTSRLFIFSLVLSALMLAAPTRGLAEGVWYPLGYGSTFIMENVCQDDCILKFTPTETGYYRFQFSSNVWSHIGDEEFYGDEEWGNEYGGLYGKEMTTWSKLVAGHHYELHLSTAYSPWHEPNSVPIEELTFTVSQGEAPAISSVSTDGTFSTTVPPHSQKFISYTAPATTQMMVVWKEDFTNADYICLVKTGDEYIGLQSWCYTDKTIYNMKADQEYVLVLTNQTDESRDVTAELREDDTPVITGSITIDSMAAKEERFYKFIPSATGTYEFSLDAENTICLPYCFYPEGYGWEESPMHCTAGNTYYVYIKNKNKFEITDAKLSIERQEADNIDVVSPEKVTDTTLDGCKFISNGRLVIIGKGGRKYNTVGQHIR